MESRYDFSFLLRLIIKAYVVDIRLERVLASDITERFLEALYDRGIDISLDEKQARLRECDERPSDAGQCKL